MRKGFHQKCPSSASVDYGVVVRLPGAHHYLQCLTKMYFHYLCVTGLLFGDGDETFPDLLFVQDIYYEYDHDIHLDV
jgi:hypothetical protein